MDLLKVLVLDMARVTIGLYGLCFIYAIATLMSKGIERLVMWIGNKITGDRQANTLHK